MKINLINKIYIGIAVVLLIATVYKNLEYKGWERYNYGSNVVVPENFPIYLQEAYFMMGDDETESIDREPVNGFASSWDRYYGTVNHANQELIPARLVLKYVSFRDLKFYSDTLDMPKDEILKTFKSAAKNHELLILSSYAGVKKGLNFTVGIANNGNVIVWLRGVNLEKVLLKHKLKSREPNADETFYEKNLSKNEFYKVIFEGLADSIKTKLHSGIDANANYVDTPSRYLENNKELWDYQKKNGYID